MLGYLGKHVCDGVRLEEGVILEAIINKKEISFSDISSRILELGGYKTTDQVIISAIHNLNLHFITERSRNQNLRVSEVTGFEILDHVVSSQTIKAGRTLSESLSDPLVVKYLLDLAQASNKKFLRDFKVDNFVAGFCRGVKYTRKDVFRVLQWDKLPNAQNVGGYIVSPDSSNCPVFVTYHKDDHIAETTKYEDRFVNPGHVIYMSKNRRRLTSPDVEAMLNHKESGMRMPFFVKKNDDEGLAFYYLGELSAIRDRFIETEMAENEGQGVSVVKMEFLLDRDVDYRLYKYLTESW